MITLLNNIKTALEADETLAGYVEKVAVRKYDPANLPAFDNLGIVVSPADSLRLTEVLAAREKQHHVQVNVIALRWRFNKDDSEAMSGVGDSPGILKFIEDIWKVLNMNTFSGYTEVLGDEVIAGITMASINNDAYYEAVIPMRCRLQSFTE